jgi:hypothetical protein
LAAEQRHTGGAEELYREMEVYREMSHAQRRSAEMEEIAGEGRQRLLAAAGALHRASCIVHCAPCIVRRASGVVRGAWCVVRGAWCVVRGAWCVVRGAWCVVRGALYGALYGAVACCVASCNAPNAPCECAALTLQPLPAALPRW